MCSQGCNGGFTHFYAGTYHAIDIQCPVGTPVLALADATVLEVKQDCNASGIHVDNLFKWNSVLLQVSLCLSIYLSIHLSIYLSIYLV